MGIKRGLDISSRGIRWVEIRGDGQKAKLCQSACTVIAGKMVSPAFASENIPDKQALKAELLNTIPAGKRKGDIALSLPDELVRITGVEVDEIPEKKEEVEKLILWRLKKTTPLPLNLIKLDYIVPGKSDKPVRIMAAIASSAVVREYEDLARSIGLRPRLVDIASLNTMALFQTEPAAVAYFITLTSGSVSIAVLEGGELAFFRSKWVDGDMSKVETEIILTMTYYQTKASHHDAINTLYLSASGQGGRELAERLKTTFEGRVIQLALPDRFQGHLPSPDPAEYFPAIGAALRLEGGQ